MRRLILTAALLACAMPGAAQERKPVRYVDAHVHLNPELGPDVEFKALRAAGIERGFVMHPDQARLRAAIAADPRFVIPFASIARTPTMEGMRLGPDTAQALGALWAKRAVCGLGEIPTRIEPRTLPTDAAALLAPERQAVYALANAKRIPVNLHVSLAAPESEAAIATIARRYPQMSLILAHAGWETGAEVMARLMGAHRNINADLSIRLDRPGTGLPNEAGLSIVDARGALKPEWRAVIERFPTRFLFALDVSDARRLARVPVLVADARLALGALPRRVEEAVAHGNAERIAGSCGARR